MLRQNSQKSFYVSNSAPNFLKRYLFIRYIPFVHCFRYISVFLILIEAQHTLYPVVYTQLYPVVCPRIKPDTLVPFPHSQKGPFCEDFEKSFPEMDQCLCSRHLLTCMYTMGII
uniref:Uncharacterized protein n=1 Tax=Cacopsylla melanoneura TaxID=428564 RepID=A0A8D8W0I9_9HEMI